MTTKKILITSITTSLLAIVFLIYIIYFNVNKIEPLYSTSLQATINAIFNASSAISLAIAIFWIKRKNKKNHILFIHLALFFSSCFLVNYIFYHMSIGHVKFLNPDYRTIYLLILVSHLICSVITLPLIFTTYLYGIFGHLTSHKKLAGVTFFMWEYVSITGVIIVTMLKTLN
jgi:putative membrane protein